MCDELDVEPDETEQFEWDPFSAWPQLEDCRPPEFRPYLKVAQHQPHSAADLAAACPKGIPPGWWLVGASDRPLGDGGWLLFRDEYGDAVAWEGDPAGGDEADEIPADEPAVDEVEAELLQEEPEPEDAEPDEAEVLPCDECEDPAEYTSASRSLCHLDAVAAGWVEAQLRVRTAELVAVR